MPHDWTDGVLMALMFLPGSLGLLYAVHLNVRAERAYQRAVEGTGADHD